MLTSFFLGHGATFFASGWTQFAGAFGVAFSIKASLGTSPISSVPSTGPEMATNSVAALAAYPQLAR